MIRCVSRAMRLSFALLPCVLLVAAGSCSGPAATGPAKTAAPGGGGASGGGVAPAMACAPAQFVADGECFPTLDAACSALGCAECRALETAPAQVECVNEQPSGMVCPPEQFVAGGKCFPTLDAACASLGCAECRALETAPAQVECAP
jgi:hypothetical protein